MIALADDGGGVVRKKTRCNRALRAPARKVSRSHVQLFGIMQGGKRLYLKKAHLVLWPWWLRLIGSREWGHPVNT